MTSETERYDRALEVIEMMKRAEPDCDHKDILEHYRQDISSYADLELHHSDVSDEDLDHLESVVEDIDPSEHHDVLKMEQTKEGLREFIDMFRDLKAVADES